MERQIIGEKSRFAISQNVSIYEPFFPIFFHTCTVPK